jgi:hypothetical protein
MVGMLTEDGVIDAVIRFLKAEGWQIKCEVSASVHD